MAAGFWLLSFALGLLGSEPFFLHIANKASQFQASGRSMFLRRQAAHEGVVCCCASPWHHQACLDHLCLELDRVVML